MEAGLVQGFLNVLTPLNLGLAFLGCLLGTLVGVLPGLGPASTLAILFPLSLYVPPESALIMMAGVYYGAMYGGSTTSILVNIPGEVSSVPTALDGFEMTKQGRAGQALAISAIGSFLAGTLGAVMIGLVGPALADFALNFGTPEYVGLMVLAMTTLVGFSGRSITKGLAAGALGMMLALVGTDPLTGTARITFNTYQLLNGIDLVPMLVGIFGVGEVLASFGLGVTQLFTGRLGSWVSMIPRGGELRRGLGASVRASVLGFLLGVLPGMVPAVTSFIAYDVEKRVSREPDRFGKGAIEGVAAAESANNATAMGGFIPLLSLGIPTGPSLAIMLAIFIVHGLQPGPALFERNGLLVWSLIASMYIGNVMLLILNLPLVGLWARVSLVPYKYLAPVILAICLVGAYAPRNSLFDVWTAVVFGVVGYVMRTRQWPMAPLVLGFILGPMFEQSLRQSLAISQGSLKIFVTRPITLGLLVAAATVVVLLAYLAHRSAVTARRTRSEAGRFILEGEGQANWSSSSRQALDTRKSERVYCGRADTLGEEEEGPPES